MLLLHKKILYLYFNKNQILKNMDRRLFFSVALCLFSLMSFTSCSDDDKDDKGGNTGGYSNLSVEQRKQKVEKVGIDLLNKINPEDHKVAIQALNSFVDLFPDDEQVTPGYGPLAAANNLGTAVALAAGAMNFMDLIAVDPGTFVYNPRTQEFDRTARTPSNGVIYQYPVGNSPTNNATIEATYSGESLTEIDGVKIPSLINILLTVDGAEQLKAEVSHTGKLNDLADYAEITVARTYVTRADITARSGRVYCKSNLRVGGEEILSMNGTITGTFTLPSSPDTNLDPDEESEKIDNADFTISVLNQLSIAGTANTRAIIDYQTTHTSDIEFNKELVDALVNVYNQNMDIRILDQDASVLANIVKYTLTDKVYYWNSVTNKGETRDGYYDELAFRFDDNTLIDIEEFTDNGFNDLINAWTSLAKAYESFLK